MKTIVIYDSTYGNTEQIAKTIGATISGDVTVVRASESNPADLNAIDLLVIGSPTNGGRPLLPLKELLDKLKEENVKGMKIAAFDTRTPGRFERIFGYAANRIAENLKEKGGIMVLPPEGFFVKGLKGPLKEGELERAAAWAKNLVKSA